LALTGEEPEYGCMRDVDASPRTSRLVALDDSDQPAFVGVE